ncbi:uncharacterized protein [Dermacentor albipictus]|uniref:uncharacterized protein isoform X2 n=1 Tax=Dermacentor albipictus TaxID=60249 RepID=UPI0038FCF3FB
MQKQPLLQPSSLRPSYPSRHNEVNKVKEEEVTAYRAIRKGKENQTSWYVAVLLQGQDVRNAASPPVPPVVIDASAKYPTGLFQGTWSDLGSFDECIETMARDRNGGEVARGQYCNVYVKMANDTSFFDEMLPNFIMAHERSPVLLRAQEDKRVLGVRLGLCTIADCSRDDVQALAVTRLRHS